MTARELEVLRLQQHDSWKAVRLAIKTGELARGDCVACATCGSVLSPVQAHHEQYAKPMAITWLCDSCHRARHAEIRAELRRNGRKRRRKVAAK